MKRVLIFGFGFLVFSCASAKFNFVQAVNTRLGNSVETDNIEDFENILRKARVFTVFYNKNWFFAEVNGTFYLLNSRGYTNFHDYREGKLAKPEEWSIFKPGYSLKPKEPDRRQREFIDEERR